MAPGNVPRPTNGSPRRDLSARQIVTTYLVAAVAWIALSDRVVATVFPVDLAVSIQTLKGWFFVLLTGALLAGLLRRYDAQRTRHAADLAASEAAYRFLAEHAADIIMRFRIGPPVALDYVSPSIERILGFPPIAFIDDPGLLGRQVDPADRDRLDPRGLVDGSTDVIRVRHRDGHTVALERRASRIPDAAGNLAAIEVLARDATDRLAAADTIRRSEERFRRITASITDDVYRVRVVGGRPVATEHSAGCEAVTGYPPEAFAADPDLWLRIIDPGDRDIARDQTRSILAGGAPEAVEHRITRRDGAVRWVRNEVVADLGPDGTLIAYDGLISDITERQALLDQLRQVQKMEAVGLLAGGIAHDFNNLLTAIRGYAELARAAVDQDHDARGDLDAVVEAADRASDLTAQLLAFGRRQLLQPQIIDPAAAATRLSEMLRRLLGEHIEIDLAGTRSRGRIKVDPGQLEQVLVNLAVNAGHAMPGGGRLAIETADVTLAASDLAHPALEPGSYVKLTVSDTGTGMDAETLARAFEPFFTTKGAGVGTGMGLAMVHGVVRQSHGRIYVQSEPGHGTRFEIYFPRIRVAATASAGDAERVPSPGGQETILLVEDDGPVREFAKRSLVARGYTILEAASGPQALDIAAAGPDTFGLLVTDLVMPGMNGRDLAERLRDQRPDLGVLFLSGYPVNHLSEADLGRPGVAFLTKPYSADVLAAAVRAILDRTDGDGSDPGATEPVDLATAAPIRPRPGRAAS